SASASSPGIGTWYWDLETNRLRWDEVSSAILGAPPDQEQSLQTLLECIHMHDRARVNQLIQESIRSGSEYEAEYRVVHRDGSEHWVAARGRTLCDSAG